jgi:coenzyme PQQ synthesis protein D (PqqD)
LVHRGTPLPSPAPSTIFKPLAEGGVLFSTSTEVYFGVNVIGARIWELLPPATATFEELCTTLASQYHDVSEAQIRRDVKAFLDDLLSNDLVVATKEDDDANPPVSERAT